MNLHAYSKQHRWVLPVLVGGIGLLLILLGWLAYQQLYGAPTIPEVTVVEFGDGQNRVEVRRDGTVTITTPFGTFTQRWDKEKLSKFFASLDSLDFDTLAEFVGGELAVQLTLSNGDKVWVVIEQVSEEVISVLEESIEEIYSQQSNLPAPTFKAIILTPLPSPTPTTKGNGSGQSSNGNPWGGNDTTDPSLFTCDQIAQLGKKVVISNTVCIK